MQDKVYSITEASELLNLENHTLRYYEDELKLDIPRNSLGHRYYREYDIKVFKDIITLKEQGLQLRAIKKTYRPIMILKALKIGMKQVKLIWRLVLP